MWTTTARFSYLGIFIGVATVLGWLFGRWLDGKFGTDPWLMLVGLLVGIAAGFKELIRVAKQAMPPPGASKPENRDNSDNPDKGPPDTGGR